MNGLQNCAVEISAPPTAMVTTAAVRSSLWILRDRVILNPLPPLDCIQEYVYSGRSQITIPTLCNYLVVAMVATSQ